MPGPCLLRHSSAVYIAPGTQRRSTLWRQLRGRMCVPVAPDQWTTTASPSARRDVGLKSDPHHPYHGRHGGRSGFSPTENAGTQCLPRPCRSGFNPTTRECVHRPGRRVTRRTEVRPTQRLYPCRSGFNPTKRECIHRPGRQENRRTEVRPTSSLPRESQR